MLHAMIDRRTVLAATLAAPAALPFIRHARAADVPRFEMGIASGTPRASGVVLWTRLSGPNLPPHVNVQWELAHDANFTRIAARGVEVASQDEAHSVHAEPQNLDSARGYWYRFTALGQQSGVGFTRTAPAADAAVNELRFAIASCQRWDHGQFAAWRHIANNPPELMLFLGDYIYEGASPAGAVRAHRGGPVRTLAGYRDRYAQYKSDPALQAAHAACPWLLVWDDHEVENDYAGLQGQRLQSDFERQRAEAYQAYWEHMPLPRAVKPLTHHMSMHSRLDWGRLARIHLLDDRQYRSPQACPRPLRGGPNIVRASECPQLQEPQRTMLGAAQEAWLAEGWSLDRPGICWRSKR
jgi:alkaline phosphatase D